MARGWRDWIREPPAAIFLGATAGALAAVAFLPAGVPVIWQIIHSEEVLALGRAEIARDAMVVALRSGASAGEVPERLGVSVVVDWHGQHGGALPGAVVDAACEAGEATSVVQDGSQFWAASCYSEPSGRVVAASRLNPRQPAQRALLVLLLLAIIVGTLTTLGILRVLSPLSQISGALVRVGLGERGIRMPRTGLRELDELVDRLNAAARGMEDREDAILARIELVQEMARLVAHEVRNPLQSLELLTSLIAVEEDDQERLAIATSIHDEIHTLEQVVTRLLRESAMKGALRLQCSEHSVAPLVEQVIALRTPEANARGIRLSSGVVSDRVLSFDQALVKRSIENLVLNALQAVPEHTGVVRVNVTEEAEGLLIVVEDNGPGVDPSLGESIFDANVSTKASGSGLGLSLVRGVMEAHGGHTQLRQSSLGGARFEARLPFKARVDSEEAPTNPRR